MPPPMMTTGIWSTPCELTRLRSVGPIVSYGETTKQPIRRQQFDGRDAPYISDHETAIFSNGYPKDMERCPILEAHCLQVLNLQLRCL